MPVLNEVRAVLTRRLFLPVRCLGAVGFAVSVCDTPSGPLIVIESDAGVLYASPNEVGPFGTAETR
jgi:hypothetical protein